MSKNFIADLKNLVGFQTYRKNTAEKIKSHNLPVIIFGAGDMARNVHDNLKNFDVEISGYAVDEKYFVADKKLNGLPIYNFTELRKTPDKYIFVVGVSLKDRQDNFMSDSSITKYYFCMDRMDTITTDYIMANQAKFIETYNLLADDFSKQTMSAYIKAQITDNPEDIRAVFSPDEYFNELTAEISRGGDLLIAAHITAILLNNLLSLRRVTTGGYLQ